MEPALHELSETLATLSGSIDQMVKAERRRNRRSWGTLALVIVMAWFGVTNRIILDTVNSVTGPAGQIRSAVSTVDILHRNAIETDCRIRRMQARLPAPHDAPPIPPTVKTPADLARFLAPYTCVAQTPPDVYPGLEGQPAKGTP